MEIELTKMGDRICTHPRIQRGMSLADPEAYQKLKGLFEGLEDSLGREFPSGSVGSRASRCRQQLFVRLISEIEEEREELLLLKNSKLAGEKGRKLEWLNQRLGDLEGR